MSNNGNTNGRELAAERRLKALELRKAGATYRAIGRELGVSAPQAYRDIKHELRLLARLSALEADSLRQVELERLDLALLAIAPEVRRGHLGAIDRWVRISERRSKLLGLDAPVKQEVSGKDGGPVTVIFEGLEKGDV